MKLTSIAILVLCASSASAQTVTGRWSATFDADISMSKDTFVVKSRRPATLELTQHGDSVTGKWIADVETVDVSGTFDGRLLKLTTGLREREVNINGQRTKMKTRIDWSALLDPRGALAGTMFVRMADREPPPRKWDAHR